MEKVCNICEVSKPVDQFYPCITNPDGKKAICISCQGERDKEIRRKRREDPVIGYNEKMPFDWIFEKL